MPPTVTGTSLLARSEIHCHLRHGYQSRQDRRLERPPQRYYDALHQDIWSGRRDGCHGIELSLQLW